MTLHRYDTVPLHTVATLPGTHCPHRSACGLTRDHDGPCADVSPTGLVHAVLEGEPDDREERWLDDLADAAEAAADAAEEYAALLADARQCEEHRVAALARTIPMPDIPDLIPTHSAERTELLEKHGARP